MVTKDDAIIKQTLTLRKHLLLLEVSKKIS